MATEETTGNGQEAPNKDEMICPVSFFKCGVIQNYRCTWRPNQGLWESRPVLGTDKYAKEFYDHLRAPKEQGGLGMEGANSLKFKHEDGMKAREAAIEAVNEGKIKAPRRNWDEKFGPQGGRPLDELKEEFAELYATATPRKRAKAEQEDTNVLDIDLESTSPVKAASEPVEEPEEQEEDLEHIADEVSGEGTYEDPSYAIETVADKPNDLLTSEEIAELSDEPMEEYTINLKVPKKNEIDFIEGAMFMYEDNDGEQHTRYRIPHPVTKQIEWLEAGQNEIDGANIILNVVQKED